MNCGVPRNGMRRVVLIVEGMQSIGRHPVLQGVLLRHGVRRVTQP